MTRRVQSPAGAVGPKRPQPRRSLPGERGRELTGHLANAREAAGPAVDVVVESPLWESHANAEAAVRRAVAAAAPAEPAGGELAVLLADDARVCAMNAHWRGKDAATNVLSFPAAATRGPGMHHLGDIVLAFETVEREARAQDKPFDHHLVHLVVHGFLHLIGYDHDMDDEAEEMERCERDILARLGIPDPYAARDADI